MHLCKLKTENHQMRLPHRIYWIGIVALLIVSIASCKKTEEEEVTPESMSGNVVFDIPYYVQKGEIVTMSASGIMTPKDAGYKWYITGLYSDTLRANTVTVQFPDSIGVFNVMATAFSLGYYTTVTSQQVTTIDTAWNTSLSGLEDATGYIVDERDGHAYGYVTVGDRDWFNQNLAWQGSGVPFKASPVTAGLFGSFYTWYEAVYEDVCPEGWSVPTAQDWEAFAAALGGKELPFIDNWAGLGSKASAEALLNGDRMWPYSPDNTHTNDVGWNAIPIGYTFSVSSPAEFQGMNKYGCWWSATEKDDDQAFFRYIWYDLGDFPMSYTGKDDMRANVRCVRMHPQS